MPSLDAHLFLAPVALYLLGSLLALVDRTAGGKLSHGAALAGSLAGTVLSVLALLNGTTAQLGSFAVAPFATVEPAVGSAGRLLRPGDLPGRGRGFAVRLRLPGSRTRVPRRSRRGLQRLSRLDGARRPGRQRVRLPLRLGGDVAGLVLPGHPPSPPGRGAPGRLHLPRDDPRQHGLPARRATWCCSPRPGSLDFAALQVGRADAPALHPRRGLPRRAGRLRHQGRGDPAARLAPPGPSGRAQPRLGPDERRHDQGRHLRACSGSGGSWRGRAPPGGER